MSETYSLAVKGIPADSRFTTKTLTIPDSAARAGNMARAMQRNTPLYCRGPDGAYAWYVFDAERSTEANPILVLTAPSQAASSAGGGGTPGWTDRTAPGVGNWVGMAMSADGAKIAALSNSPGDFWLSTDSGENWSKKTAAGSHEWQLVGMSSSGSVIAATYGPVFAVAVSVDGGSNWSDTTIIGAVSLTWISVSGDGVKVVVGDPAGSMGTGGALYISTNSGSSFAASAGAGTRIWTEVAISRDGSTIVATTQASGNGKVLVSTNAGTTWNDRTPAVGDWDGLAVSADGTKIIVSMDADVWYSSNAGVSFAQLAATALFGAYNLAMADSGSVMFAAVDVFGNISRSDDTGASWTTQDPPGALAWSVLACSSDGKKAVNGVSGGHIWTANFI